MNRRQLFQGLLGVLAAAPVAKVAALLPVDPRPWSYRITCYHCGQDVYGDHDPRKCRMLQDLVKALEAGNYNAAPSKLVQGCGLQVEDLAPTMAAVTYDDKPLFYKAVRRKNLRGAG